MPMEIRSTWFGTFLVDGGRIVRELRSPEEPEALSSRLRSRREGSLTPEEHELLGSVDAAALATHDRRFLSHGVRLSTGPAIALEADGPEYGRLRDLLLSEADEALRVAWDPSIHLDEAVRAMTDVDRTINLLGERLASWTSRDRPELAEEDPDAADRAAAAVVEARPEGGPASLPEADPALIDVRRRLAESYGQLKVLRRGLDHAVEEATERRAPNLSALLGPLLAARLLSQAGGLDRLARLPSSTVQVLGAEGAFFEHLRRGTRPPRHGLLFLHPAVQGAPKRQRGRMARALAGKASIAARLDRAGKPLDPAIVAAFTRRADEVRRSPKGAGRAGSRPPLHRAAEDR
jgi:nucleolar protein 56